jgi:hypothetical protein
VDKLVNELPQHIWRAQHFLLVGLSFPREPWTQAKVFVSCIRNVSEWRRSAPVKLFVPFTDISPVSDQFTWIKPVLPKFRHGDKSRMSIPEIKEIHP